MVVVYCIIYAFIFKLKAYLAIQELCAKWNTRLVGKL